jgi:hypothetical protein
MICRQSIALYYALGLTNDIALANLSGFYPLLVVHKFVSHGVQECGQGVVSPSRLSQLCVVAGSYPNEGLPSTVVRCEEGSANSMAFHGDDVLAREEIYRHAYRELVLPA